MQARNPDWVVLSNALLLGMGRRIREATGAKVACTLQGEDGFLDALGKLRTPHRMLGACRGAWRGV